MELEQFNTIRQKLCLLHEAVTEGKMMHSPAIHYYGKVFAFFSRKKQMVFKLGYDFRLQDFPCPLTPFSPFKTKKPLKGWYALGFEHHEHWETLAQRALSMAVEYI